MDKQLILTLIATGITFVTAFGALVFSWLNYRHSRRTLRETRLSERRKALQTRLNDFYGPLLTYMSVILGLYRVFFIGKPEKFRTLTYLLDRNQVYESATGPVTVVLTDSDKNLVTEIIELEKKVEEHVIKYCGAIDDRVLGFEYKPRCYSSEEEKKYYEENKKHFEGMGMLAILLTHFRVLRMAFKEEIKGELTRFRPWAYPKVLDVHLKRTIEALENELRSLGGDPARDNG